MSVAENAVEIGNFWFDLVAGEEWKEVPMDERAELILCVLLVDRLPKQFLHITIEELRELARGSWDELDQKIRRVLTRARTCDGQFHKHIIRQFART